MDVIEIFQRLGLALGIGFLVGVERGWKQRNEEDGTRAAGLRTYTLIGLLGGVSGLLGAQLGAGAFIALTVVFGAAWLAYKLWETWVDADISVTGTIGGILVFALGAYATLGSMQAAAAAGVVLVAVLAFKEAAHEWVKALTWAELRSAVAILAATLIALPLLPDLAIDPYGAFNPRELWLLTIVIAGAGFGGYVALRVFGARVGLFLGAAVGALVSSTAVTLDLARRTKASEIAPLGGAAAAALANVVMFVRVGALIGLFAGPALPAALPAIGAAVIASLAAAGGLVWLSHHKGAGGDFAKLASPLDFVEIGRFALILALVTAAARIIAHFFGHQSLIGFAAAAGLVDVDAVALAVGGLARGGLPPIPAAEAILLAAAVNTMSKSAIASIAGARAFALPYAAASALALGAGAAAFLLFQAPV
ncbi:MAG: DUF4010 domain-containing protein [Hyphomonadaceae bacterium]|nr:DUF4010 domain-containing protein [Hyphomonadaceae bacterium]